MDKTAGITMAGPTWWRRQKRRLLVASGLVALSGCLGEPGRSIDDDPIYGGGRAIPQNAAVTSGARGVADGDPLLASDGAVAQLPPLQSATSPAALTAGVEGVAVDGRPPGQTGITIHAPVVANSATRLTPVPASPVGGVSTSSAPPASPVVVQTSASMVTPLSSRSFEQLQQDLQARGVAWQQLKTGVAKDEWLFACAIPDPNPDHKNIEKHYEARAVGAYGLAAIRAVIEEIDKDAPSK